MYAELLAVSIKYVILSTNLDLPSSLTGNLLVTNTKDFSVAVIGRGVRARLSPWAPK